jgi:outer membrane protein OmpA-like peptidoglycan-associated protein/opacity protein-like surface antigen
LLKIIIVSFIESCDMNKLLTLLIVVMAFSLNAQNKSLHLGVGGGFSYGVNEGYREHRNLGPLFGANLIYVNGLMYRFSPEFNFNYTVNGTNDFGERSQYETTYLMPDLRLRYHPFNFKWEPYAYGGVGAVIFNVDEVPFNKDPESVESGTSVHFPVGVGVNHYFNETFGVDFNVGVNFTLTDDLNPVYDDIFDGMWSAKLSVLFKLADFEKDSDRDGLSDELENSLGTDPNNPDTDGDGLLDGEEVNKYKTDPKDKDTDNGGIMDGIEVRNGANPLDADDDILSIAVGEKLILRNIEFNLNSAEITPTSERILNFALNALKKAPDMEIQIVGHTDNSGEEDFNLELSQKRADAVKIWLTNNGINADRISTLGKGETEPLVPNDTEANKQKNRRVEFIRTK